MYELSALCIDVLFVSTEPIHKISTCNCSQLLRNCYGMWPFLNGVPLIRKHKPMKPQKKKKPKNMRKLLVKFQDNWKIGHTWLMYPKADNKMFCDICKRHNVTSRNIITKNTGSQSTLSVKYHGTQ